MKRTTIFIAEEMERDLQAIAKRRGVPTSSLVRSALGSYLMEETRKGGHLPAFVAVGRSGTRSVAERHEDLLWKGVKPHGGSRPRQGERRRKN